MMPFRALERLRAQAAAEAALLVDDGFEAELHQLIGRDNARQTAADDRDLLPLGRGGDTPQAGRMLQPIVIGERKVRPECGEGFLDARGALCRDVFAGIRRVDHIGFLDFARLFQDGA